MFSRNYYVDRYLKNQFTTSRDYMTSTTRGKIEAIKNIFSTHYILSLILQKELNHAPGSIKVKEGIFKKLNNLYSEISSLTKSDIFCSHVSHLASLKTYNKYNRSDI